MRHCIHSRLQWFAIILLLAFTSCLFGQAIALNGVVVDPDGAAVSGAEVLLMTLKRTEVAGSHSIADASGRFRVSGVPIGDYLLEVLPLEGFETYQAPVHVFQGMHEVRAQLALARVTEDVVVAPSSHQLALDSGSNGDQISADASLLERVPVFDQDYIAALTPFLDQTSMATSGISIVVDGVEMNGTGVSASAIAEAHINNDPYTVETSRPGRGQLEIITKPGSPQLRGALNFTFRDSVFDAKNYFAITRPFEQKRIYEGSLTGPVRIDSHTTFLLSGSRQEDNLESVVHAATPTGVDASNVPTPVHTTEFAARLSHDFSDTHRASLQYNVTDVVSRSLGVGGLVRASAGANAQAREDDIVFNDRVVVSPTLLTQFQLLLEKDHNPTRSATGAEKIIVDGAFTGGGAQADILNTENNGKINEIVSWTHGRHSVKFGINLNNLSRRAWEDHSNRLGTFKFASLQDYETNTPYSFTQQIGPGRAVFWMDEIGAFIQDQIVLRPNLQASIGIRYDWQTFFKSVHDFAPRASLAYANHDRKIILRGGVGIFYDRSGVQPMADLARYNGEVLHSITLLNPIYPDPYLPGFDPAQLPTDLVQTADETHIPYVANYSATLERQLSAAMTLGVTYRGTLGVDLFRSRDVNAPLPPDYDTVPNPQLGVVRQIESEGRQLGNALDVTINGKASRWFSGMAQYTLSRTNNDTGGVAWFPANQYSLAGEYGRSDFDQRHRFNLLATVNADYWLNLGLAAHLYSGTPYTETSGDDTFHTGLLNARPAGVGRNTLETAGAEELDLRWSHELFSRRRDKDNKASFFLAIDAFNITNTANFTSYVGNLQSDLFEQPTAALPGRRLQFTGRIKF